jgi:hypothetical protein
VKVWAVYLTRDTAWCLFALAVSEGAAMRLAEEHAAPYIPFGEPKWRVNRAGLDWRKDEQDCVAGDDRPDRWTARHQGEHYVIQPEQVQA